MEQLLRALDAGNGTVNALRAGLAKFDFATYCATSEFTELVGRARECLSLRTSAIRGTTARNVVKIAQVGDWVANVAIHHEASDYVFSRHAGTTLVNVSCESEFPLTEFYIDGLSVMDPIEAKATRLPKGRAVRLSKMASWTPDDPDTMYRISSVGDGSIWITISGPVERQYLHCFECASSKYLYSAFSTNDGLGYYYFAELVKEYIGTGGYIGDYGSVERENILRCIERLFSFEETSSVAKWSLSQAMLNLNIDTAIAAVNSLATDPSGIGIKAREAIARL